MVSRTNDEISRIIMGIKYIVIAFISTFAISAQYVIAENRDIGLNAYPIPSAASGADNCITNFLLKVQHNFIGNSFVELVIVIALFCFYKKIWENAKRNLAAIVLAIACAVFYIVGKSYALTGSDALILSNTYQIVFSLFCFMGFFFLLTCVFEVLLQVLDVVSVTNYNYGENINLRKKSVYALIIFLSWLPYLAAYYPGNMPFDTFGQLNQYLGLVPMTNHFPVASTLLVGWCYSLGKILESNIGLFLYVIIQALVGSIAFSEVCVRINKLALPKTILYATLAFYCILPTWATSVVGIVKDYTYYPIMLLYVLTYIDIVKNQQVGDWKRIVKYIIDNFST